MKEHPILFSAPMIRALLAGTKTQTRRAVKDPDHYGCLSGDCPHEKQTECAAFMATVCPYGIVGDKLWVKETFYTSTLDFKPLAMKQDVIYEATPEKALEVSGNARGLIHCTYLGGEPVPHEAAVKNITEHRHWKLRPSIYMPRWASRITLEITGVRVERVQDISEADCLSEGCPDALGSEYCIDGMSNRKAWYADLWDKINGKTHPWESNPLCWCISFRVASPPRSAGR